jgi:GAF domain-containing protein
MRRGAKGAKAKVKAELPVARRSLKNKGSRGRQLEKRLAEALEQQTATSEILRVISSSRTDVQPVFDAIIQSATRLCEALNGTVFRFDGSLIHVAAHHNIAPEAVDVVDRVFPIAPGTGTVTGRAILSRAVTHVLDMASDPEPGIRVLRQAGFRAVLSVPMLRDGAPIGAITVTRREARAFSDDQIALLQTFADQAVIAIENVQLITELQQKNRALTQAHAQVSESLEQQTATSDILRVISSSPTDVQPTFDAIAASATQLCGAVNGLVIQFDGHLMHLVAHHNLSAERLEALGRTYPLPPSRGSVSGRSILTRSAVQVPDVLQDPEYTLPIATTTGYRSALAVPMLRDDVPIGTILVARDHVAPFSDKQIALLQTFADQAVIAVENVRLFKELAARNRDLTESLEQQTATSEILRVISRSQTDVQPVFDTIVRSAVRLCNGLFSGLMQFDGEMLHHVAQHNFTPEALEEAHRIFPMRPTRALGAGRAILERAVVHIPDVELDPEWQHPALSRAIGFRSGLFVPMLREGAPFGVIVVARAEPGPFSDNEIELLKTFADQAVIAVENVRLFTELQASNRELTTALDTQTATSDILRVISQSQTDVQPVFDAIVDSAVRLLRGNASTLSRIEGDQIALAAMTSTDDPGDASQRARFPMSIHSEGDHAQAVRNRVPLHSTDAHSDPRLPETQHVSARLRGYRSLVVVPLVRHDEAVGALGVARREPGGFTDDEIALLKTFADQAVIAIENVRLFTELQEKNSSLTAAHAQVTEALEQQTATAEILRVISRSQTDVQPVFDTIVRSAVRLCDGLFSALYQFDGELIHHVAQHNFTPEALEEVHRVYPTRPTRALGTGRTILERGVVHIPDVEGDPEFQHQAMRRAIGQRSGLWVPMLREGAPIGVIFVARAEAGPFSDSQVELLKTFADQAVIAVENVRLFKELEARTGELTQSVEKLTALGEVSRAVSSTLDVETVLNTIVSRASQLAGAAGCSIYEYDEGAEQFELRATHHDDPAFVAALRAAPFRKGEGLMGRAAEMREPIQIPDITQPGAYQSSVRDTLIRFGYRALLAVPLIREDQIIGSLSFNRKAPGEFPPEVVEVLKTFATQSALAIQNARLFREIADKSAQLEAASRHKSEFLANMSHELRTPLNAIIGFSEVLVDRMFGELNEKQDEYLKDIYASGQHLLSLINDILDLSKIEAGRMELELSEFDLPSAIDNALILVRERATRRGIRLGSTIDPRLGMIGGDERKVKQVLLNLLSNALKFTPEGGRIEVGARPHQDVAEVSVSDTGIGIAPADQDAVFEEFRQVGTADKKAEGTGLGLALSRKFIELHGGRIWVKSEPGTGSTFTFTLPLTIEQPSS